MSHIVSVADALQSAVLTAQAQPREVPEAPQGWLQQATVALDAENEGLISIAADTILLAHCQYRAEFDIKGWLYDLRNAVRAAR